MSYVYTRNRTLYVGYVDRSGKEIQQSTGINVDERDAEKRAKQALRKIEDRIVAESSVLGADNDTGPVTVAAWSRAWIVRRKEKGVASWKDDEGRMRLHVLPTLGAMLLEDVRAKHLSALIVTLTTKPCQRDGTALAARTVRHVHTTLRAFFRDAVCEELLDRNPCDGIDARYVLPAKLDKNPEWRMTAHFDRDEIVLLVTDARIPWDRRAFYAVMFLAGLRFGEVSALSWRHYDPNKKPLGRLTVAHSYNTRSKKIGLTKTQVTRAHPVHATLHGFLEEWRKVGWPMFFGRAPGPDDLIVPSRLGNPRSNNHMKNKFDQDLETLGLRKRRQHDARKSWLTQLHADGAVKDTVERITHARPSDVMSGYIELEWPTLCAEVAKWTLTLPAGPPEPDPPPRAPAAQVPPPLQQAPQPLSQAPIAASSEAPVMGALPVLDRALEERPLLSLQAPDRQKITPSFLGVNWRSGRDSNPRPPA